MIKNTECEDMSDYSMNLMQQVVIVNHRTRAALKEIAKSPRKAGEIHRETIKKLKQTLPLLHRNLRVAAIYLEDRDGAPAQLETAKQAAGRVIDSLVAGTSSLEHIKEEAELIQDAVSKATGISVSVVEI